MHYNFPETTFSQVNTFAGQMAHVRSEAKEITGAKIDSDYELDEATDLVHSWETLRRIDPARVQASIERVKLKNAARGYYVDSVDKSEGCGGECGCKKSEPLWVIPPDFIDAAHKKLETEVLLGQSHEVLPGYETLYSILMEALDQSQKGKGKERHANSQPFEQQPMLQSARMCGGGLTYQVMKKTQESTRLPKDRAVAELLGAIVYAAGEIIRRREEVE